MGTQMIGCSEVFKGKVCGLGLLRGVLNVAVQVPGSTSPHVFLEVR